MNYRNYRPNFQFTYNGKRLCLNDISDWAFFANKLFDGAYDDTIANIHGMDDWEDSVFPWEREEEKRNHLSRKGRNRKAKQNGKRNADKAKRFHKADRYHGKKLMVIKYKENHEIKEGLSWLYRDCHCPVGDDVKYSLNSIKAKEKDYSLVFTGIGELLEDIAYLEDRIYIYEEDIKDLEYEKAFGYLTDRGEEFLEDYKKELEELKEYKKYKEVLLRTATH